MTVDSNPWTHSSPKRFRRVANQVNQRRNSTCRSSVAPPIVMKDRTKEAFMPAVNGLLETSLYVNDLTRSADFYRRLFGFETLLETPGRLHAMNVAGRHVLLLFGTSASDQPNPVPGGVVPAHDGG